MNTSEPWSIALPRRNRTRNSLSPSALALDSAFAPDSPGNILIPAGSGSLVLSVSVPETNAVTSSPTPTQFPHRATIWSPAHNQFLTFNITASDTDPTLQESATADPQDTLESPTWESQETEQIGTEDLNSEEEEKSEEERKSEGQEDTSDIDSHGQSTETLLDIAQADISNAFIREDASEAYYADWEDPNRPRRDHSQTTVRHEPPQTEASARAWQHQARTRLDPLPVFPRRTQPEANVPYVFRYQRQGNTQVDEQSSNVTSDQAS